MVELKCYITVLSFVVDECKMVPKDGRNKLIMSINEQSDIFADVGSDISVKLVLYTAHIYTVSWTFW